LAENHQTSRYNLQQLSKRFPPQLFERLEYRISVVGECDVFDQIGSYGEYAPTHHHQLKLGSFQNFWVQILYNLLMAAHILQPAISKKSEG
jgi:hypothetical protein